MRNVFGDLEFEIGNFFVPHRPGATGKYHILKHERWYVTNASFAEIPWDDVPPFDSFIQACIWLKAHYTELL